MEFEKRFSTEEACRDYLLLLKLNRYHDKYLKKMKKVSVD